MRKILFILTALISTLSLHGQGGYLKPGYLGWPPASWDSTEWPLVLNPLTGKGKWTNPGSGGDSVVVQSDSLCFIVMGDTLCPYQDSIIFSSDSACFTYLGDYFCVHYSTSAGNIYTISGALTSPRTLEQGPYPLSIIQSGVPITTWNPSGGAYRIYMHANSTSADHAILQLDNNNSNTNADSYIRMKGVVPTTNWSFGLDHSLNGAYVFSDTSNLTSGNEFIKMYTAAGTTSDSISVWRQSSFWSKVGINKTAPARDLDIIGMMNLKASAANQNVFINGGISTATGANNIAIGNSSTGAALTSGGDNILLGPASGQSLTTGNQNIIIGSSAATLMTTGVGNIIMGTFAGGILNSANPTRSVLIGQQTGYPIAAPDSSVLIGYKAGNYGTVGAWKNNTIIGFMAGQNSTGARNVFIGWKAGQSSAGNDKLFIDNSNTATPLIGGDFASNYVTIGGRLSQTQGADVASVAGAITLGNDGNTFEITGTNAITLISNIGWQNGSEITLIFTSTATLTDGTANSVTDIGMELAGNANFSATADDVVKLVLCEIGGTQRWREVSRSAN